MEKRFRAFVIAAALLGILGSIALYFAVSSIQLSGLQSQFQRDASRFEITMQQRLAADIVALDLLEGDFRSMDTRAERFIQVFDTISGLAWLSPNGDSYSITSVYGALPAEQLVGADIPAGSSLETALVRLPLASEMPVLLPVPEIFGATKDGAFLVIRSARADAPNHTGGVIAAVLDVDKAAKSSLSTLAVDQIAAKLRPAIAAEVGESGNVYWAELEPVAGQTLILEVMPTAEYFAARSNRLAYLALMAALLVTGLTTLYLEITLRRADQVKLLIAQSTEKLNEANRQLELLTLTDELTGAVNRRGFDQALLSEWGRAKRDRSALTLLMIDIDYFKNYNDHYGHPAGDKCLRQVAQALAEVPGRLGDLVARYGGEEFAVILPNTEDNGAVVAQRCRGAIEALQIPHEYSEAASVVTASIGSALCWPHSQGDFGEILEYADAALYEAKAAGRNRVETANRKESAA